MRRLLVALLSCLLACTSHAAAPTRLDAGTAQRDLRILQKALVELHPAVDRYVTPEALDAAFAAAQAEVAGGADRATMYRLASRLSATLRCGHTWTNPLNQRADVQAEVFAAANKLPVWIKVVDDRFLVVASSDPQVRRGDELLAIDGRPAATLIAELLPYLRADGSSDGKRRAQLDSDSNGGAMDRLFPALHPPQAGRYRLRLLDAQGRERTRTVRATSVAARDAALARRGIVPAREDWSFAVDTRSIATLRLPTFAFWNRQFDWKTELDRVFAVVGSGTVRGLIIDLRDNEGGDDDIGDRLHAWLLTAAFTKPAVTPYSRFERVPYTLARFLDTWDFSYFDRTGKLTRLGDRRYRYDSRIEPPLTIQPVVAAVRVPTAVLTGPQMSSAGFIIARDLKLSGAATLIGRRTGGNRRGLNGGELGWITLPGSGVAVDIAMIAWEPDGEQPDGGIEPDIAVAEDFDAIRAGRDPDDEAARRWLAAQ